MQGTSLVKYNTPILVNVSQQSKHNRKGTMATMIGAGATVGNNAATKKMEKSATTQTEDILNSILPPR